MIYYQNVTKIKYFKILQQLCVGLQTGTKGGERQKKETGHSRLVGGKCNKQGKLHIKLVSDDPKLSRSLFMPTRILKFYIEALLGSVTYTIQVV